MIRRFEKQYPWLKVYLKASHLSSKINEMPNCKESNRNQLCRPFTFTICPSSQGFKDYVRLNTPNFRPWAAVLVGWFVMKNAYLG